MRSSYGVVVVAVILAGCAPTGTGEQGYSESPPDTATASEPPNGAQSCKDRVDVAPPASRTWESMTKERAATAIDCDAQEILTRIVELAVSDAAATSFTERLEQSTALALGEVSSSAVGSSRLPLSKAHAEMFAVAAEVEHAAGFANLVAWATNPWAPLSPMERTSKPHGSASTLLMRGERRPIAINIRNISKHPQRLEVKVELPKFPADSILIHRVNWTGTDQSTWVAAEIAPLGDASAIRELETLPGITQQLWIEVAPNGFCPPGRYVGNVSIRDANGSSSSVPIEVVLLASTFRESMSLHFGGWDYTAGAPHHSYAVTEGNREKLIEYLQARHVDTPWALRGQVMDWTHLDRNGDIKQKPNTSALEAWFARWPHARRFRVHLAVRESIAGIPDTDPRFAYAVSNWARSWANEIRNLNKDPAQFDLLFVDEPASEEDAQRTQRWADAVRASGTGFRIWTDPLWADPAQIPEYLVASVDTISINISFAERSGNAYWNWAKRWVSQGKTVELYACDGPARRLDPYAYYRLPAWRAFFVGASAVSFWSFSDNNLTAPDNEFAAGSEGFNYSPLFITADQVLAGKHMEAAAQGIQDVQYLTMLRHIAQRHSRDEVRQRAQELLDRAETFVASAPRSSMAQWQHQSDADAVDRLRGEIGRFIDSSEYYL